MGAVEIIAELSCNHLGDYSRALRLMDAAMQAGADAIKLQVDNPDGGITIDCDAGPFRIKSGPWAKRILHDLYCETHTPWNWVPRLMEYSAVEVFATPSCFMGVAFLERCGVKRYKVSSFEITDTLLLRAIAATGKPTMVSLGCAEQEDIERLLDIWTQFQSPFLTLMHCVSRYPTPVEDANLARIPILAHDTGLPIGLSDHSLGDLVPTLAVALGACAIEKHLTLSRADGGPDAGFSMEPAGFAEMVRKVRLAEQALQPREVAPDRQFVKSLFVVRDMQKGERFTKDNVGVIRPGDGLKPYLYDTILGKQVNRDVKRGEPLVLEMLR